MSSSSHKSCNVPHVESALFIFYSSDGTFIFPLLGKVCVEVKAATPQVCWLSPDKISENLLVYRVGLIDKKAIYLEDTYRIDYQDADGLMYGMTIASKGDH